MFMKIDIGIPGIAIRREKVLLKFYCIDFLISVVQDVNGSVSKAQIQHITGPESDHITAEELLNPKVGGHLSRSLIHQITIVVIDEGSSTSILVPSGADEDVSRVNLASLIELNPGRFPWAGAVRFERPVVGHCSQR